jgi:hypothetical protein
MVMSFREIETVLRPTFLFSRLVLRRRGAVLVVPQRELGLDVLGLAARAAAPHTITFDWMEQAGERLREV